MKKKYKLLSLFTSLCLASCGDITSNFVPSIPQSTLLNGDVTKALRNAKDPMEFDYNTIKSDDFKAFLEKFTDFSLKFNDAYLNRYDNKYSNVAISPLSVFFALAMTSECAANNSKAEVLNALNMTTSELRKNLPILYSIENTSTYSYDDEKQEKVLESVKDLNNSIWFSKEVSKKQSTLENLANYYFVDSYETDFLNKNSEANKDFKDYVKDKTRGLIDPSFELDTNTLLVLLNTFYLKDIWNDIGRDLPLTDDYYAFNSRVNDCNVGLTKLMMGEYFKGRVLNTDTYSSFFTKTQNGFKIHFLKPNNDYKLEDVFTKENINNILDLTNYEYKNDELKTEYFTETYFPSFEASCDTDITPILSQDFEIKEIFNSYKADFSNISTNDMYVSQVMHQTKLKVERKGIEGAAITALIDTGTSAPDYEYKKVYETFIVDKAFGYVITDSYGVTLFSGVVNDI
ncbi:MAG: hypothetical protein J1F32_06810 [Erysipelotrichales bacterium]|nr:hypothetical protein [Erysipelotrichales bacterium]